MVKRHSIAGARPVLEASVPWSYSRRDLLEQCPRRYYYEYYGSAARAALTDPNKPALRLLKRLQNRYERAGMLLHLVIATYFRRAQAGDFWTGHRLASWAREVFRQDRAYSAADPDGTALPGGRYPPVLLREYHYRQPEARGSCDEVEERLVAALQSFATSAKFAEFRANGAEPGALVEAHLRIPNIGCKVDGRLDLAYDAANGFTIVDWKLGSNDGGGDDSLQLAAYALWARDHLGHGADSIRVCKAHLGADEVRDFSVTEEKLAAARARILQDVERLMVMHDYGQRGIAEAFTPYAHPKVCQLCPFQRVCPAGSRLLHA